MIWWDGYHQVKLKKSQTLDLVRGYHQVKLKKSQLMRRVPYKASFFLHIACLIKQMIPGRPLSISTDFTPKTAAPLHAKNRRITQGGYPCCSRKPVLLVDRGFSFSWIVSYSARKGIGKTCEKHGVTPLWFLIFEKFTRKAGRALLPKSGRESTRPSAYQTIKNNFLAICINQRHICSNQSRRAGATYEIEDSL